jgi:hypothetical protein
MKGKDDSMRELKINKEPIVRNYSNNLNSLAIPDTDLYRGDLIARVSNFNIYSGGLSHSNNCIFQGDNIHAAFSEQEICFYTDNQYAPKSNAHLFANAADECVAEVAVDFIQQGNPWSIARLSADPISKIGTDEGQKVAFEYTHFVGIMCADGITASETPPDVNLTQDNLRNSDNTMKRFGLKLEIGSMIKGFCRIVEGDWKLVFETENTADESYIVGLAVIPQENCIDN